MRQYTAALFATAITIVPAAATAANHTVCDVGCDFTSIQDAIDHSANNGSGQDRITVGVGQYEENLVVGHDVEIRALSMQMGSVDVIGDGGSPVLIVYPGAAVTVRRLVFSEGGGTAGIVNYGELTLVKTFVRFCDADFGGILNSGGTLTVKKASAVFGNIGSLQGGGISNNWGQVAIDNATISGNTGLHGGGLYNDSGIVTITGSSFSSNHAQAGGAWYNINPGGTVDFQASSSYSHNEADSCDRYYGVNASPQCAD